MATLTGRELYDAIATPYRELSQLGGKSVALHNLAEGHLTMIRNGTEPAQLQAFWEELSRYASLAEVEASRAKSGLETDAAAAGRFDAAAAADQQRQLHTSRQAVEETLNFARATGVLEGLRTYAQRAAAHGHGLPEAAQQLTELNQQLGATERALEPYVATLERGIEVASPAVRGLPEFAPVETMAAGLVEAVVPAPSGPGYDDVAPDPRIVGQFPWLERTARRGILYDQPVDPATGRPGLLPAFDGDGVAMVTMSGRQISAAQSLDASLGDDLKVGDARIGIGSRTVGEIGSAEAGYGYDRSRS